MPRNALGRSRTTALALLSLALLATSAEAQDVCARANLDFDAAAELAKQRFASMDYDCAVDILGEQAHALLRIAGRDGFDARFSLRELALGLLTDEAHPAAERIRVLTVAAAALDEGTEVTIQDIDGDVSMLLAGSNHFLQKRDVSSWLALLETAIVVDQRHPSSERWLPKQLPSVEWPFGQLLRTGDSARLLNLATLVRDDAGYDRLRGDLASELRSSGVVYRERDPPDVVRARCAAVLQLVELLTAPECPSCPADWRLQPLLSVGYAYSMIGMPDKARGPVDEALRGARSIEDPERRMSMLNIAFNQLVFSRYDSGVVIALANETLELANASERPIALEMRERIPRALANAGLSAR